MRKTRSCRSLALIILVASLPVAFIPHATATVPPKILLLDLGTPEAPGALQLINMSFVKVSPTSFLTTDLNMFDVLFVGWDGTFGVNPAAFTALSSRQADIASWVGAGHGVVALWEFSVGMFHWLPLSVNITAENADSVSISAPSHPIMANLTDALLSSWANSYHNYFTSWNPAYQVLAITPLHGLPVTLAATLGSGRIAITGQDPDWHLFYRGTLGAAILLRNMINWAGAAAAGPVLKNTNLFVAPIVSMVGKGSSFSVNVNVANVTGLYAFDIFLAFDPTLLTASTPTDTGNVLHSYCSKTAGCSGVSGQFTSGLGFVEGKASLVGMVQGFTGTGLVFTIQFTASKTKTGTSLLHIESSSLGTGNGEIDTATGGRIDHFSVDGAFSDDGPDLFVSLVPNRLTVSPGASGNAKVSLYSLNGLTGSVAVTVAGLPAGVTATLAQSTLLLSGPSANTTLALSVGPAVSPGNFSVIVTGTTTVKSQSLSRSTSLQLAIPPPAPDFSVSLSPATVTIPVGGAGSVNITVSSVQGFSAPVTLSLQGLPLGGDVTSSFNIDPVTPPVGGKASSTLTLLVFQFARAEILPLTITARSAGITHTAALTLEISTFIILPPPFLPFPPVLTLQPGQRVNLTLTVASVNNFTGTVQLSTLNIPSNVTATLFPTAVVVSSSFAATSLNIQVGSGARAGTFVLFVIGTSGTIFQVLAIELQIVDFSIATPNLDVVLPVAGSASVPVFLASLNGFAGLVSLNVPGSPPGVSVALTPSLVNLTPGATASAVLTISASGASAGNFAITVTATNGPTVHSMVLRLHLTDFSLALSSSSLTLSRGQTSNVTVTLLPVNGFSQPVTLSISGVPADVTATFTPSTVSANTGPLVSALTLSVGKKTVLGTFTLLITATSGAITHTFMLTLTVTK